MSAEYRKLNDGTHNSSTYHKKDGTPVRGILKNDLQNEIKELSKEEIEELELDYSTWLN